MNKRRLITRSDAERRQFKKLLVWGLLLLNAGLLLAAADVPGAWVGGLVGVGMLLGLTCAGLILDRPKRGSRNVGVRSPFINDGAQEGSGSRFIGWLLGALLALTVGLILDGLGVRAGALVAVMALIGFFVVLWTRPGLR